MLLNETNSKILYTKVVIVEQIKLFETFRQIYHIQRETMLNYITRTKYSKSALQFSLFPHEVQPISQPDPSLLLPAHKSEMHI